MNATNTAEYLRIDNNGNVGIGVQNPNSRLDLGNAVATNGYDVNKITLYNNGGTSHYGFGVSNQQLNYRAGNSSDQHVFWAGTSERMRIDGAGRVTMPYQPAFGLIKLQVPALSLQASYTLLALILM